ncbi:MAG: ribose transport system permease protein [Solirubrobacteraceae bacterium]|nr:ribose transport system permease protein [Solirubrobacteraceae bacterium]
MSGSVEQVPVRPDVQPPRTARSAADVGQGLARWATIGALLVMVVAFSALKPDDFATWENIRSILSQGAILAIIAGGLTLCLISWDFDLSIGAMATLGGLVSALLVAHGIPLGVAALMTAGLGATVGLINGIVVVKFRVSAFIGTLAMMSILGGVGLWWTAGVPVPITNVPFMRLAFNQVAGIPLPVLVAIGWYAVLWVVLERGKFGRKLYAVGSNQKAARLAGIRVPAVRIVVFTLCAAAAALAGLLLASTLAGGYQGAGDAFLLDAYAAVFLGAVTLRIGKFDIVGTAVGILILAVMTNGLNLLALPSYVISIVKGVILIVGVAAAGISRTGRTSNLGA